MPKKVADSYRDNLHTYAGRVTEGEYIGRVEGMERCGVSERVAWAEAGQRGAGWEEHHESNPVGYDMLLRITPTGVCKASPELKEMKCPTTTPCP